MPASATRSSRGRRPHRRRGRAPGGPLRAGVSRVRSPIPAPVAASFSSVPARWPPPSARSTVASRPGSTIGLERLLRDCGVASSAAARRRAARRSGGGDGAARRSCEPRPGVGERAAGGDGRAPALDADETAPAPARPCSRRRARSPSATVGLFNALARTRPTRRGRRRRLATTTATKSSAFARGSDPAASSVHAAAPVSARTLWTSRRTLQAQRLWRPASSAIVRGAVASHPRRHRACCGGGGAARRGAVERRCGRSRRCVVSVSFSSPSSRAPAAPRPAPRRPPAASSTRSCWAPPRLRRQRLASRRGLRRAARLRAAVPTGGGLYARAAGHLPAGCVARASRRPQRRCRVPTRLFGWRVPSSAPPASQWLHLTSWRRSGRRVDRCLAFACVVLPTGARLVPARRDRRARRARLRVVLTASVVPHPSVDVLIHGGGFTRDGPRGGAVAMIRRRRLPHAHKIVVDGNHVAACDGRRSEAIFGTQPSRSSSMTSASRSELAGACTAPALHAPGSRASLFRNKPGGRRQRLASALTPPGCCCCRRRLWVRHPHRDWPGLSTTRRRSRSSSTCRGRRRPRRRELTSLSTRRTAAAATRS